MFTCRQSNGKRNIYKIITILALFFLCVRYLPARVLSAGEAAENFYDYVREERRRESGYISSETAEAVNKAEEYRQISLYLGRLVSGILSLIWLVYMFFSRKKYVEPYKVIVDDNNAYSDVSLTPIEASAIINMKEFTRLDLIATLFDVLSRGYLSISECNGEIRIYLDNERMSKTGEGILANYEDFLVGWLFGKIGGREYFSTSKLWDYLSANSRAAEFDIDYDIWIDEANEYVKNMEVIDEKTEKWKRYIGAIGILYAAIGLLLLYFTSSTAPVLLFGVTFLSYKMPIGLKRRSIWAETEYMKLMLYKNKLIEEIQNDNDFDNFEKWDKYFIFCIIFGITEKVFAINKKFENIYCEIEREFDKAIIYANSVIYSPIE